MKDFFSLKPALFVFLGAVCSAVLANSGDNVSYDSRFYQGLSQEYKEAIEHVVQHHSEVALDMAMRAIGVLEKMIVLSKDDQESSEYEARLSSYAKAVQDYLQAVAGTRVAHDGIMVPMFNCCTPRDAYFRAVVTNLLTVTGDATIYGNLTVNGSVVVTGTQVLDNLIVTGTGDLGALRVHSYADIADNLSVGGDFAVDGASTFNGEMIVNNDVTVTGQVAVTGGLVVAGTQVVDNLIVTGTGDLGALRVHSYADIADNLSVGGDLAVDGDVTVVGSSDFQSFVEITSSDAVPALEIDAAGGTGVGLGVAGNTSQPAVSVTQGVGQNAIQVAPGTVTSPSYSFAGSAGTGLYSPAANRFALAANGVDKINYDGTSVLMTSQHRFSMGLLNDQNIPAGQPLVVPFDEPFITSDSYDPQTGVFTVPVTGAYLISFNLFLMSDAVGTDHVDAAIRVNGTQAVFSQAYTNPGESATIGLSIIYPLTAGQTVDIRINAFAGNVTLFGNPGGTFFGIHLLSVS